MIRTHARHHGPDRPFVFINAAMSADGKIAPHSRVFVPFGSPRDQAHLLSLRTLADAVIVGAETVNGFPMNLGPGPARYRRRRTRLGRAEYNLRVVVSGSGSLNPDAEIFRHRFSPILVLTTRRIAKDRLAALEKVATAVKICGQEALDFAQAFRWLRREWGVRTLVCEGGGKLYGSLLRAGLVDEVHATICPLILGGQSAPTLADTQGFSTLAEALTGCWTSIRRRGSELFVTLRLNAQ